MHPGWSALVSSPPLSLSLSFAFLPLPVSAFIYSDGKTRKEGSKTGEKARGGSSGEDEDEEEEGESKTNKRIRGGKIVLKDLKLSFRQYALPAVKTRIGSSFISEPGERQHCWAAQSGRLLSTIWWITPHTDSEMFILPDFRIIKKIRRNIGTIQKMGVKAEIRI